MNTIQMQLEHENWAFCHGYSDERQISLVADFLNGIQSQTKKIPAAMTELPMGIHISQGVREAFSNAGRQFAAIHHGSTDTDLIEALKALFAKFGAELSEAVAIDGIMASTGDCRGACQYNVGDRTEYRSYGW